MQRPARLANWTVKATRPELEAALAQAERELTPATPDEIISILGQLALHYWRPDFDATQARLLYGDYIEDLKKYPAALIKDGVAIYRRQAAQWFPKIGELIALIDPMHRKKLAVAADIRARLKVPEPERRPSKAVRAAGAEHARKLARGFAMNQKETEQ